MSAYAHRTDTGSAAAVWDTECLVQVQVGDIATKFSWLGDSDECIQIRSVDIDLTSCGMNLFADRGHACFKHTVR